MTAKRFMVDDAGTLIDMYTRDTFDYVSDVCDLLNEQHETIQRLKQNIDELLSVDIEEELLKENKQLKKENYELHKRLGDFEPFERHIKERTSKISLKDIIGIVKTDEPTNSVELKKELYK